MQIQGRGEETRLLLLSFWIFPNNWIVFMEQLTNESKLTIFSPGTIAKSCKLLQTLEHHKQDLNFTRPSSRVKIQKVFFSISDFSTKCLTYQFCYNSKAKNDVNMKFWIKANYDGKNVMALKRAVTLWQQNMTRIYFSAYQRMLDPKLPVEYNLLQLILVTYYLIL